MRLIPVIFVPREIQDAVLAAYPELIAAAASTTTSTTLQHKQSP